MPPARAVRAGCRLVTVVRAEVRLDDARVVADRVGRALRDRVPEVERDDAVAGLQDQRHVVLDDEHADPAPRGQRTDHAAELGRFVGVEARGGLVEQEHGRFGHERAGDADEARDTVRQRRRPHVEHVAELQLLDDLVHERGRRRAPRPEQVGEVGPPRLVVRRDEQVLAHRHLLEQLDGLPRPHDAGAGPPLHRPAVDGGVAETDRSARRRREAGDDVEDRRLARAVRADEPDDLAGFDREAHAVDRDDTAELHDEVA